MIRKVIQYGFSTKIALISGAPKYDLYASQILSTLKKLQPQGVEAVGVIGDQYSQSFSNIYASSNVLDNHEFQVTRAYNSYHEDIQDSLVPYRIYTHFKNYKLIKQLQQKNFFNDVFDKNIDAVTTVGNFSLALRIGQKLNEYSQKKNKSRPFTSLFHRQASERTVQNEEFIDYQYYNIEKTPSNNSGYVFPSYCVGYEGLFKVFQHLQKYKLYKEQDLFNFENFTWEVSELIKKARAQFRTKHQISEDKYIIYIDAGDNVDKINFSFKSFKNGLKEFLGKDQIKGVNPSHFQIFVINPANEKLSTAIKGKLGFLPEGIKVTLIEEKDKYGALCASDFGMLHNGQATVEAAGAQLPSLVVDNMSNVHAYFNNLFNGHASPLNIATNYEGYEDLCGSLTAIGGKIGTLLLKHFETPKLRYYYAKLYKDQIIKILSKSGTNPQLRVGNSGLEIGLRHFLRNAVKSRELGSIYSLPSYKRVNARKQAFNL